MARHRLQQAGSNPLPCLPPWIENQAVQGSISPRQENKAASLSPAVLYKEAISLSPAARPGLAGGMPAHSFDRRGNIHAAA